MRAKKIVAALLIAAFAVLCLTGCSGVKITDITLGDVTLKKGESVTLNTEFVADKADADAEALNKAIEKLGVTFTVADESIAQLEGTTLTALDAGETTITAASADGALSVTAKVVVEAVVEEIEAEDILLNTADESVAVEYTLLPEGVKAEKVEFTVADEGIATVKDGKLAVVAAGKTELTIAADGVEKTVAVTVQQAPEKLAAEDVALEIGATAEIAVDTGLDDTEAEVGLDYTYTSADEEIATVDKDGVVTGVAAGETAVTVENELGQKADCKVEVTELVKQQTAASKPSGNTGAAGNAGTTGGAATTPSQPSGGNETPAPAPEQPAQPAPQPDPAPEQPAPEPQPPEPQHYHGNGSDWGNCPVCGLAYSPVIPGGGVEADSEVYEP